VVIPDANLLIYAYQRQTAQHKAAVDWLQAQLAGEDIIGLCWPTLWAFVRIGSNTRIWRRFAAQVNELLERIDEWQAQPNVVLVEPGPRHKQIFGKLVRESGVTGNLISDAALAAIAIEHAATLASTDRDFRRFSGLRWIDPLDQA
jgi:toxin-antitoxin system PIN domain toxin